LDLYFSETELDKLHILKSLSSGTYSQIEAASYLKLSTRQVRRLQRRFEQEGPPGIKPRHHGSNRKYSDAFKANILSIVRRDYHDFGPTFAAEKLLEINNLRVSKETLRHWMMSNGLWKGKSRKAGPVHQSRNRRPCLGELIQIDGSHHKWFEERGPTCCLYVMIDDATSQIMAMHFALRETTIGYFTCLEQYLYNHGRPIALYSDRHSIFKTSRPHTVTGLFEDTEFKRALGELKIEHILAYSPQAKGRVERANKTLQDRLLKEMRLRNISSMEEANAYLPEFIKKHNERFAVEPTHPKNAHRALHHDMKALSRILSKQKTRCVNKALEFSYNSNLYQIQSSGGGYQYRNRKIDIFEHQDGQLEVVYEGKALDYKVLRKDKKTIYADRKDIDNIFETKIFKKPENLKFEELSTVPIPLTLSCMEGTLRREIGPDG